MGGELGVGAKKVWQVVMSRWRRWSNRADDECPPSDSPLTSTLNTYAHGSWITASNERNLTWQPTHVPSYRQFDAAEAVGQPLWLMLSAIRRCASSMRPLSPSSTALVPIHLARRDFHCIICRRPIHAHTRVRDGKRMRTVLQRWRGKCGIDTIGGLPLSGSSARRVQRQ